jgi:hypothetical protein
MDPIRTTTDWQLAEHLRAQRDVRRFRAIPLRRRFAYCFVLGVTALLIGALLARAAALNGFTAIMVAFGAAALIALAGWIGGRVGLQIEWKMTARRMAKRCADRVVRELSSEGLRVEQKDSEMTQRWSGVEGVVETEEFFLFYVSRDYAFYFPKHGFEGVLALSDVRTSIVNWLGPGKRCELARAA